MIREARVRPTGSRALFGRPEDPGPSPRVLHGLLRLWAAAGGSREFEVEGRSMHPILAGVRRLRVRMGDGPVRFGDIVLYVRAGRLIAHRSLGRRGAGLRTRGDASRGFDPEPLSPSEVLGVATHLVWQERIVPLEGPGSVLLRWLTGAVALAGGLLGIDPEGPSHRTGRMGRWRDAMLGPPYRGALRCLFAAYAVPSRAARRIRSVLPRRAHRTLLEWLALEPRPAARDRLLRLRPEERRAMVERAIRLGMGPALLDALRRASLEEELPPEARRALERIYYGQCLYNTRALRDLATVLGALGRAGIRPVVLKGAALACRLYPGLGLRSLSDLDLLVEPAEAERAAGVLRQQGYRPMEGADGEFFQSHHHQVPLLPPRGGPRVEVHTGLVDPRHHARPPLAAMRERSKAARFGDATAFVFAPADQLVHACIHLALGDRFVRGAKDLVDIDRLARSLDDGGWDLVAQRADAEGCGRAVTYAIGLAQRLLGTPVPDRCRRQLRRHRLPWLEDGIVRHIAALYLLALPESEEFFGLARGKGVAAALLTGQRTGARWRGVLAALRRRRSP